MNSSSNLVVIIPVKSLAQTKSRLANFLTPSQRAVLTLNLLQNLVERILPIIPKIFIITTDPLVIQLANHFEIEVLPEEFSQLTGNANLNRILKKTVNSLSILAGENQGALILPCDLPLITTVAIELLIKPFTQSSLAVIVSDKEGLGTNGLLLPFSVATNFEFSFGLNSFALHCANFKNHNIPFLVYSDPLLQFDLDTPADFALLPTDLAQELLTTSVNHIYN